MSDASVSIREARPGDEESLFALVQQLGHAFAPDRAAYDVTLASYFAGEHPSVLLLVVDDGSDRLGGYALTTIVPLLATNGPSAQLQEIVVDEQARGRDYGTMLVRAVEAECERRGVTAAHGRESTLRRVLRPPRVRRRGRVHAPLLSGRPRGRGSGSALSGTERPRRGAVDTVEHGRRPASHD